MPKHLKYGLSISIIGIIAFVAFIFYYPGLNKAQEQVDNSSIITEKPPENLSLGDVTKMQEALVLADQQLAAAQSPEEKYAPLVEKAKIVSRFGKLSDARTLLEHAIAIDPDKASGLVELFEVQIEMNDFEAASETIESLLKVNSSSAYWKKYIDFETNQLKSTQGRINDIYLEALVATDQHISIIEPYARFQEEIGNFQLAKEFWQMAITKNPEDKARYDVEVARLDEKLKVQQ